jgi:hypothetical protein
VFFLEIIYNFNKKIIISGAGGNKPTILCKPGSTEEQTGLPNIAPGTAEEQTGFPNIAPLSKYKYSTHNAATPTPFYQKRHL